MMRSVDPIMLSEPPADFVEISLRANRCRHPTAGLLNNGLEVPVVAKWACLKNLRRKAAEVRDHLRDVGEGRILHKRYHSSTLNRVWRELSGRYGTTIRSCLKFAKPRGVLITRVVGGADRTGESSR